MSLKFIILNGPPGSGKDTIADALKLTPELRFQTEFCFSEKFAYPLKILTPMIYGITATQFRILDAPANKDTPQKAFKGKTPREVQIALSETFFKPLHGPQIFGELLANRAIDVTHYNELPEYTSAVCVVSDGGFIPEFEFIHNKFGDANVLLVRVHREGHAFDGDSRSYIPDSEAYKGIDVQNVTGQLDEAVRFIVETDKVKSWLKQQIIV